MDSITFPQEKFSNPLVDENALIVKIPLKYFSGKKIKEHLLSFTYILENSRTVKALTLKENNLKDRDIVTIYYPEIDDVWDIVGSIEGHFDENEDMITAGMKEHISELHKSNRHYHHTFMLKKNVIKSMRL